MFLSPPQRGQFSTNAPGPMPLDSPAVTYANLHPAWIGWFTDVFNLLNADAAAIAAGSTNIAGGGGGTTNGGGGLPGGGGTPVPVGTPVVTALPGPTDPLSVVGQYVIFGGTPYVFAPDPSGGPTGFWKIATVSVTTIFDTHANRASYLAANYPVGALYYETDTTVSYAVQAPGGVKTWMYYNGVRTDVLANIPALGVNDVNYTFQASDYKQIWVWTGTAWNFAPGSSSGYFINVANPSFLPYGTWGLFDGSTYAVSQNDATTTPFVTGVVAGQYVRR